MSELASTAISSIEITQPAEIPEFARLPISEVTDLEELTARLHEQGYIKMEPGEFGFGFRSMKRFDADTEELDDLDDRVVVEAEQAPGFKKYEKGIPQADGSCISICFWESAEAARAALNLPAHAEAVRRIEEFYDWCTLDYMAVSDTPEGPKLIPVTSKHLNFTI